MPSLKTPADIFTRLPVFYSPKDSSNTFKNRKNISLYFKRRYLIIYKYWSIEHSENKIITDMTWSAPVQSSTDTGTARMGDKRRPAYFVTFYRYPLRP